MDVAHDMDFLPFPSDVSAVLQSLGFHSVYDITMLEADRFRLDYDRRLNGSAAAIYTYAQRQVGVLDNYFRQNLIASAGSDEPAGASDFDEEVSRLQREAALQVARYHRPLYQQLFNDNEERCVEPGALQSLDSPVCYLTYLVAMLQNVSGGEALRRLVARRPDLTQLLLDETSFRKALPSSDLAGEILVDALDAIFRALPKFNYPRSPNNESASDTLYYYLATKARYPLTTPFDVPLRRIEMALESSGLRLGDILSDLLPSYRTLDAKHLSAMRRAEVAYSSLSPEQIAILTGKAPDDILPFNVAFDERGLSEGGTLPSIALAGLWPTLNVTNVSLTAKDNVPLTCIAGDKSTANVTLKWQASGANGVVVLQPQVAGTLIDDKVFRGDSTWYARHDGSDSDQVEVSIGVWLIGSKVGADARAGTYATIRSALEMDFDVGVGQATAVSMRLPVPLLCQAAHISPRELETFYGIGTEKPFLSTHLQRNLPLGEVLPGHYGASYLWGGQAIYDASHRPGTVLADYLLCTPSELDRLQRLIRLKHHLHMPVVELDCLLNAALHAEYRSDARAKARWSLSSGTCRALGMFLRWRDAYGVDADSFQVLLYAISPYAIAGHTCLLDRLFKNDAQWKLDGQPLSSKDTPVLARAFGVQETLVDRLIDLLGNKAQPKTKSLDTVSAIYRPILVARLLGLSVEDLLELLLLLGPREASATGTTDPLKLVLEPVIDHGDDNKRCDTLDLLLTLDQCVQWCRQNDLSLGEWVRVARTTDNGAARNKQLHDALCEALSSFEMNSFLLQLLQEPGPDFIRHEGERGVVDDAKWLIATYNLDRLVPTRNATQGPIATVAKFLDLNPAVGAYVLRRFQAVVSVVATQTGVAPGAAAILTSIYLDQLNTASVKLADPISFAPLFIGAAVVSHYGLTEEQLLPLTSGVVGFGFDAEVSPTDWQWIIAWLDYAHIAQGDQRLAPARWWADGSKPFENAKASAASVLGDKNTAEAVLEPDGGSLISRLARVQRLLNVSSTSGWSVFDANALLTTELTWERRSQLSLHCCLNSKQSAQVLDARLSDTRTGVLLSVYKAICRRFTVEFHHLGWNLAYREREPETVDVAATLLIDPEMTAKVPSTRVAEAIASLQAFIQRIAEGAEPGLVLTPSELERWHTNDSRYSTWAANVQLRWHPEQYLNPASRINKTDLFRKFETRLAQSRLDRDAIDVALREYLNGFEHIINVDVIGGYQDGLDQARNTVYFLGRSKNAPYEYYYRSWGLDGAGIRVWSEWHRIEVPSIANVVSDAARKADDVEKAWKLRFAGLNDQVSSFKEKKLWLPVQARLVVVSDRLYFAWVEPREVSSNLQSATKAKVTATRSVKTHQYVVSVIHRGLGGDWSAPVELYKSIPTLEPDSYPPHLAAFSIPEQTIQFPANVLNRPVPAGDLLFIALLGEPLPFSKTSSQTNAWQQAGYKIGDTPESCDQAIAEKVSGTTYLLLDTFLSEVTRNALWGAEGSVNRPGVAKWDGDLGRTIQGLILNSYRWIVHGDAQDRANPNEWFYSTGVVTPCVPKSWLSARLYARNSLTFGPGIQLALDVDGAGQIGRDSYEVKSTVSLPSDVLGKVPPGRKLVHFLEVNGVTRYASVGSENKTLSLFLPFDNGLSPCVSSVKYGLVLAPKSATDVVLTDGVDDVMLEACVLTVARGELQTMAADIRENQLGVQFLLTRKPDVQDIQPAEPARPLSVVGISVEPRGVEIESIAGVEFKLLTDIKNGDIGRALTQEMGWMPASFCQDPDRVRYSPWAYNLNPNALKPPTYLATRCAKSHVNKAELKKTQQLYNAGGEKIDGLDTLTDNKGRLHLVQEVKLECLNPLSVSPLFLRLPQPMGTDGKMADLRFEFHALSERETGAPFVVPGVGLSILSQHSLKSYLANLTKSTLFTLDDWGWMPADFMQDVSPAPLTRTFNLASADKMYFAVKITKDKIHLTQDNATGRWTGCGVSVTSRFSAKEGYVLALDKGEPKTIPITAVSNGQTSSDTGFYWEKDRIYLDGPDSTSVKNFLAPYSHIFIVLPWIANDFRTAADKGLLFRLINVYDKAIVGHIHCNVASLARVIITSSYSGAAVRIGGDTRLTINVDLSAEPELSPNAKLVINLGAALEIGSPTIMPNGAKVQKDSNGTAISIDNLHYKPGVLEFNIPVTLLDVFRDQEKTKGSAGLLSTVTVSDNESTQRVKVATFPIMTELRDVLDVSWQWWFGSTLLDQDLTRVDSKESISTIDLKTPFLIACFKLGKDAAATLRSQKASLTLTLPEGLSAAPLAQWEQVKAAFPDSFDLADQWETLKDTEFNISLSKLPATTRQILVPLELTADSKKKLENKKSLLLQPARVSVSCDNLGALNLNSAIFKQPIESENKAKLSAICDAPNLTVRALQSFNNELKIAGGGEASIDKIELEYPTNYQPQSTSATLIGSDGAELITGEIRGNQFLTFNLKGKELKKSDLYTLKVPMVARPLESSAEREPGNNRAQFAVTFNNLAKPVEVSLNSVDVLPLIHTSISTRNVDGSPLGSGGLSVGNHYCYEIDVSMSEAELKAQIGLEADLSTPLPGFLLIVTLPKTTRIISESVTTTLPTLTDAGLKAIEEKSQADGGTFRKFFNKKAELKAKGFYVDGTGALNVYTLAQAGGLKGTVTVPFEVFSAGVCWADLAVKPFTSIKIPKTLKFCWAELQPMVQRSPWILGLDGTKTPFTDLRFLNNDLGDAFSDPRAIPRTIPLAASKVETRPLDDLIRLNTLFGRELARIAQRDSYAVFESATQEHRQAPLRSNDEPELLENDSANLMYFWEVFFHAPFFVAYRLNLEGRYEEAQEWLRRLFEPFPTSRGITKETDYWRCRLLTAQFRFVPAMETSGPVDPDSIASHQPVYYRKALFFAYVKNLIDKGDSFFREISRDGMNQARQCYLLAMSLMGAPVLGSQPRTWQPCTLKDANKLHGLRSTEQPGHLFSIPRSHQSQDLWEKLAGRLHNLRNGLSLDGKPLSLPIYDQPLSPATLLSIRSTAAAGGITTLAGRAAVPAFRYGVMYSQATAAVDILVQFGTSLLAAIDRQQDFQYQSLLQRQQQEISQFLVDIQAETVRMSAVNRRVLMAAYEATLKRSDSLKALIDTDISSDEKHALQLRSTASIIADTSGGFRTVAAGLDVFPRIFGFSNGGQRIGAIADALAQGILVVSEQMLSDAASAETREQYRRRKQDWESAKQQVDDEAAHLKLQLDADLIQSGIYEKQLAQTQLQLRQLGDQAAFMRARFSNEALLQWMIGQVSTLYYQAYDTVSALCLLAQEAWRYETGEYASNRNFFQTAGWSDSKRGLLAGETLRLGLLKMQREYLTRGERQLELIHTFSLQRDYKFADNQQPGGWLKPYIKEKLDQCEKALQQDASNAVENADLASVMSLSIPFKVKEEDLASRYPGHYMRQLVSVSVTLAGLIGPYEDVSAMLVQKSSRFSFEATQAAFGAMCAEKSDPTIVVNLRPDQSIALSSGLDDSGLFVMNFGDDRLLPFEGNGVVGEWELIFFHPGVERQKRLLESLSDVLVRFHYRAKDGGSKYATDVSKTLMTKRLIGNSQQDKQTQRGRQPT